MEKLFDIIVIGGGPAGISAGIYAHRAGMNVLVIDGRDSTLKQAKKIDNYYGVFNISGEELIQKGIDQYVELGGAYKEAKVVSVKQNFESKTFTVKATCGEYCSKAVILCTGTSKKKTLPQLEKYEGTNVSYCAVCDGFFYRGLNVAVIGDGDFAFNECEELSSVANQIYLITENKNVPNIKNVQVVQKKVADFVGENKVEGVVFEDGSRLNVDGVFVALGTMSSFDIAKRLGILMKNNFILVDKNYMTNIAGVFAGGDAIGGLLQVSKAVSDGANAGLEATRYIKVMEHYGREGN